MKLRLGKLASPLGEMLLMTDASERVRVIASSGDLKGYAWGQHRKRWLLEHEGALVKSTGSMEAARLPGF